MRIRASAQATAEDAIACAFFAHRNQRCLTVAVSNCPARPHYASARSLERAGSILIPGLADVEMATVTM